MSEFKLQIFDLSQIFGVYFDVCNDGAIIPKQNNPSMPGWDLLNSNHPYVETHFVSMKSFFPKLDHEEWVTFSPAYRKPSPHR